MKGSQWLVVVVLAAVVAVVAYQAGRSGQAPAPPPTPKPAPAAAAPMAEAPSAPAAPALDAPGEATAALVENIPDKPRVSEVVASADDLVVGLNADLDKVMDVAVKTAGGEAALKALTDGARYDVQLFAPGTRTLGELTTARQGRASLSLQRPEATLEVDKDACVEVRAGAVVPCSTRREHLMRAMRVAIDAATLLPLTGRDYKVAKTSAVGPEDKDNPDPHNSLNFTTRAHGALELSVEVRLDPADQSVVAVVLAGTLEDNPDGFPRLVLRASRHARIAGARLPTEWKITNDAAQKDGSIARPAYPGFRLLDADPDQRAKPRNPRTRREVALQPAAAPPLVHTVSAPVAGGLATGLVPTARKLYDGHVRSVAFLAANPLLVLGPGGAGEGGVLHFAVDPGAEGGAPLRLVGKTWARGVVDVTLGELQQAVATMIKAAAAQGMTVAADARPVAQFLYEARKPDDAMPVAIWLPIGP